MTVLVGALCSDGIVIGADTAATHTAAGGRVLIACEPCEKIDIIDSKIIVAGTGSIGLGQRFVDTVKRDNNKKPFSKHPHLDAARAIAKDAWHDYRETGLERDIGYGSLVAFASQGGRLNLCEFQEGDLQPEFATTDLCVRAMGGGIQLAGPFLAFLHECFFKQKRPNVATGTFVCAWALEHTIRLAPIGIRGPYTMAVLRKGNGEARAEMLTDDDLTEHMAYVKETEEKIAKLGPREFSEELAEDVPPVGLP